MMTFLKATLRDILWRLWENILFTLSLGYGMRLSILINDWIRIFKQLRMTLRLHVLFFIFWWCGQIWARDILKKTLFNRSCNIWGLLPFLTYLLRLSQIWEKTLHKLLMRKLLRVCFDLAYAWVIWLRLLNLDWFFCKGK